MLMPRENILPINWSRKQRHLMLNKALKFHPVLPIFKYINQKGVLDSALVLRYKDEFLKQVYGKTPYDPSILLEMLTFIDEEMNLAQVSLKQVLNEGGRDG